jgi:NitT/TauT family transport system permease protein
VRVAAQRGVAWAPAIAVFGLGIVIWQWVTGAIGIESFLLPRFSVVMSAFFHNASDLWSAGWFTFKEALGGFGIGCGLAFASALVLARWRGLGEALMPYAIAANAVPIIAFAPITNAQFGALNPISKMAIAAVLCYFPVLVNTLRGLTSVRPSSVELMHSYAAGELEIFRRVRIPSALPHVFTGLKVGCVLAMIGAIIGDYFGGTLDSLGQLIREKVGVFQLDYAWALVIVSCLIGIGFYGAIALLERTTMAWHPSTRQTE